MYIYIYIHTGSVIYINNHALSQKWLIPWKVPKFSHVLMLDLKASEASHASEARHIIDERLHITQTKSCA